MNDRKTTPGLILATVGVVFGDIGTSPLYALKEVFVGHHRIDVTTGNVLGVLSLITWTVVLLVAVKYVALIMRADNQGEGGSLSLLALVQKLTEGTALFRVAAVLGIFAAALFYGDSMITPAISVLSAVEGLQVIAPHLAFYIVPITLAVLSGLFWVQKHGTAAVGVFFGPVMCFWFLTLAVLGTVNILQEPSVFAALNPLVAIEFLAENPTRGFLSLGAVVLAVTGGEALYTDMGHFGRFPIRLSWFGFVMPALILNYFGQAALLIRDPAAIENSFYLLAPGWAILPLVVLATLATVIASQAVISGAFSVANQAVQLGYLPRMRIVHTSHEERGQIYVPFTNLTLFLSVVALVIGFRTSSNLAGAYGIAVSGTMMIDTILVGFVMALMWRWHAVLVALIVGGFLAIDATFLAANAVKVMDGGWFPLIIAACSFSVLMTWHRGRELVRAEQARRTVPLETVINSLSASISRARGTAVFLTSNAEGVPAALLHNLKHNQTLHERVILATITTTSTPYVNDGERVDFSELGNGFYRLVARYGFMENPDVPTALRNCARFGVTINPDDASYFLSRETIVPKLRPAISLWREKLFAFMALNATPATSFFNIPTERVVELGTQLEI